MALIILAVPIVFSLPAPPTAHPECQGYRLKASLQPTNELTLLNRRELGWLLAARTGHGDYVKYHSRFEHHDAVLQCNCGNFKTPAHVFFCRYATGMPFQATRSRIDTMLGLTWREFIARIRMSRFYTRVCPWNNKTTPKPALATASKY